jgi:hypothetical protein
MPGSVYSSCGQISAHSGSRTIYVRECGSGAAPSLQGLGMNGPAPMAAAGIVPEFEEKS